MRMWHYLIFYLFPYKYFIVWNRILPSTPWHIGTYMTFMQLKDDLKNMIINIVLEADLNILPKIHFITEYVMTQV